MKLKVLVVDDEKLIRKLIGTIIEKTNKTLPKAEIIYTDNGDDALKIMEKNVGKPFDLVITDINMPGKLNGFDVILQAKKIAEKEKKEIIIFAMSGRIENHKKALEKGANIFFDKPLSIADIISHIKTFFPDI